MHFWKKNLNEVSNFAFGQNSNKTLNLKLMLVYHWKLNMFQIQFISFWIKEKQVVFLAKGLVSKFWRPRFKLHNWDKHGQGPYVDHM